MANVQTARSAAACNPEAALVRLGDDRELYREVLTRFFVDSPNSLVRMRAAIEKQDGDELHRAAHSYKGLAAMSGTEHVAASAAELEQIGKAHQLANASEILSRLEQELAAAREELIPFYQ